MTRRSCMVGVTLLAGIVAAAVLAGCPTTTTPGAQTRLTVMTIDSDQVAAQMLQAVTPPDGLPEDAAEVIVHIDEIRLVPAGEEQEGQAQALQDEEMPPPDEELESTPIRIPVNPPDGLDLDLLTLSDTPIELAEGTVPAGEYAVFGLIVSSGEIRFTDPNQDPEPLKVPSGGQAGLRVQQHFTLSEGAQTITLDWNSDQTIHRTGEGTWIIRPTSLRLLDATGQEVPQEPPA